LPKLENLDIFLSKIRSSESFMLPAERKCLRFV